METLSVKVEQSGRILIPAELRRRLGLNPGSEVLMRVSEDGVLLETRAQAVARVQERFRKYIRPGVLLSEELIQDRREEARREDL